VQSAQGLWAPNSRRATSTIRRARSTDRGVGLRDVVGLVLGSSLHREETGELLGDGGPVGPGGAEEHQRLVVIPASSPLPQAHAGHRIGGVDPGMDRQARRRDCAAGVEAELAAERYSSALLT